VLLITKRSEELSDFKLGLVIGYHISKKSIRDIATLLNLPLLETLQPFSIFQLTVGEVIVKCKREGTTTTKPSPSRPCLMTDRSGRALKRVVHKTR
jgi:hypothetical protein